MKRLVDVDLNSRKITNLADGSSSGDAVNKGQLDTKASTSHTHTVSNITDYVVPVGYVNHGSTAGTSRPSGFSVIVWSGTVEPTNATNGDIWIDTN